MTFDQIPPGAAIFLDANTLVYHFTNAPIYGAACTALINKVAQKLLVGFTSTNVLADVAHRVMTLEAMTANGWPVAGLAARLRKNHDEIPKLTLFEQAIGAVPQMAIQVIPILWPRLKAQQLDHETERGTQLATSRPPTPAPWCRCSLRPGVCCRG